ncbi:MAG: hypothetical protein R3B48_02160 [Kofleriaceae bacterium]
MNKPLTGDFAVAILQAIEDPRSALDHSDIAWLTPPEVRDAFVVSIDALSDPGVWKAPIGQCLAACYCVMRSQNRRNGEDGMLWNLVGISHFMVPVLWECGAHNAASAIYATAKETDDDGDEAPGSAAVASVGDQTVAKFLQFRAAHSEQEIFSGELVDEVLLKLYELARTNPAAFDDPPSPTLET